MAGWQSSVWWTYEKGKQTTMTMTIKLMVPKKTRRVGWTWAEGGQGWKEIMDLDEKQSASLNVNGNGKIEEMERWMKYIQKGWGMRRWMQKKYLFGGKACSQIALKQRSGRIVQKQYSDGHVRFRKRGRLCRLLHQENHIYRRKMWRTEKFTRSWGWVTWAQFLTIPVMVLSGLIIRMIKVQSNWFNI